MSLSKMERETIISFTDADDTAEVYSTSQAWMTKIKKLGGTPLGEGYVVEIPKTLIKIEKSKTTKSGAKATKKG